MGNLDLKRPVNTTITHPSIDQRKKVYNDIFEMLPSVENPTPMVRINRMNPCHGFTLFAKLEWMNPFGSVKDRPAWQMLRQLEKEGQISTERGLVEPTSGNTGFSLAMMARTRGYSMRAVVPNMIPLEKKILLKIAGAELDVVNDALCPAPGLGDGSINMAKTRAKAEKHRYVLPNQYENEQNVLAHYHTTGPEIWRQTDGMVTHVFFSLGTCGTVSGVSRFLREKNPQIKIIAVQPTEGHDIPGLRNVSQLKATQLFDETLIDNIMEIDYELAYTRTLELCQKEGLTAGPSCGLIYEGARQVIETEKEGVGVMIFPDSIFKYTANMAKHLPFLTENTTPP